MEYDNPTADIKNTKVPLSKIICEQSCQNKREYSSEIKNIFKCQ